MVKGGLVLRHRFHVYCISTSDGRGMAGRAFGALK